MVYRAYGSERPVLSGGRMIGPWKKLEAVPPGLPAAARGKVWMATVPEARDGKWPFRQSGSMASGLPAPGGLNERGPLPGGRHLGADARSPAAGPRPGPLAGKPEARLADGPVRCRRPQDIPRRQTAADLGDRNAEVFALIGGQWATMRIPIEKVNGPQLTTAVPMGYFTYYWGGMSMVAGGASGATTGHIENAMSLLAAAGQWYLDSKGGLVYYVPAEGEDPNAEEFIAPRLEQLLCLRGTADKPIRFVEMHGLSLEHAEWRLPELRLPPDRDFASTARRPRRY